MILHRPSNFLKSRIQYDPFHVLHFEIPTFPDQTEAAKSQQSNTNTKWLFCARSYLQECQHLIVTVSMERSALQTSINIQFIKR